MRRRLRPVLPALRLWFGLAWEDIWTMPAAELQGYLDLLAKLPPPGVVRAALVTERR